jgi:tRNA modification GTPase
MNLAADSDTIAALATPPGRGGIGVVRVSGPRALELGAAIGGPLPAPRTASLRVLRGAGEQVLDRGILISFPAPGSFTGEDVVELHTHGSPVVLALLMQRLVMLGAREAGPGEFTRRAYVNGRIDLAQAEAVADLIASASAEAARAAMRSLEGEFSARVTALAEALVALRVRLEAGLDFPEEGVDDLNDPELGAHLQGLKEDLDGLRAAAARGRVLRDGLMLVIAGAPNAGKSSLLNRLAGYEAAIVTELPGTTRDLVREDIVIDGMPVRIVDTAGLREGADRIEAEGIRRAHDAMGRADLVVLVQDGSAAGGHEPAGDLPAGVPVLRVINKIDLVSRPAAEASSPTDDAPLLLSALTGEGIEELRMRLKRFAGYTGSAGGAYSARRRHLDALELAGRHLDFAGERLAAGTTAELAAEELRLAHAALCEITGAFTNEDLLGRIFGEFCIGK